MYVPPIRMVHPGTPLLHLWGHTMGGTPYY